MIDREGQMDDDTYLCSARQLSQAIRGRAAECESLRRLPDETCESYQRSGLLRALQPPRWVAAGCEVR